MNLNLSEELQGDVKVEDCAHANGTEETNVQGLPLLVDLWYVLVHGEDDGWPTK
jgi:hypothetical protein